MKSLIESNMVCFLFFIDILDDMIVIMATHINDRISKSSLSHKSGKTNVVKREIENQR